MSWDRPDTPITPGGLRKLDGLPAAEALVRAWTEPGPAPRLHEQERAELHRRMPLVARALDRLAAENGRQ